MPISRAIPLLFCIAPLFAQERTLELDASRARVHYTLPATLHTVHGTFALKRAALRYDPASGQLSGEIVIDARSGNSGNEGRDSRMHREILESARYPEIVFTPDRVLGTVAPEGKSQVEVHGLFKIHGQDHELTIPVEVETSGDGLSITAEFTIPYVQWGIRNPSTLFLHVSDKVTIDVSGSARFGAPARAN